MQAKFEITSDIMQAAHWSIFFSKINELLSFWDHIVTTQISLNPEGRKEGGRCGRAERLTQISSLDLTTQPPIVAIESTHLEVTEGADGSAKLS